MAGPTHTSLGDSGRVVSFIPIVQSGAGTTLLVAAVPCVRIKVAGYVFVMSAAGTAKFVDDVDDLTGAMPFVSNGGASAHGNASAPLFAAGINKSLSITTTGGGANGHLAYFLEV